jgi:hypothetical protein
MLKRLLHIVLAAWLINALICFHPGFSGNTYPKSDLSTAAAAHPDVKLPDGFLPNYSSNKTQKEAHHRSASKNRYFMSRVLTFDIWSGQNAICSLLAPRKTLRVFIHKMWENKFFLPPHHNYLFRLSLF